MKVYILYESCPLTMNFETPSIKDIYATKKSAEKAAMVLDELGEYKYSVREMKVIE